MCIKKKNAILSRNVREAAEGNDKKKRRRKTPRRSSRSGNVNRAAAPGIKKGLHGLDRKKVSLPSLRMGKQMSRSHCSGPWQAGILGASPASPHHQDSHRIHNQFMPKGDDRIIYLNPVATQVTTGI